MDSKILVERVVRLVEQCAIEFREHVEITRSSYFGEVLSGQHTPSHFINAIAHRFKVACAEGGVSAVYKYATSIVNSTLYTPRRVETLFTYELYCRILAKASSENIQLRPLRVPDTLLSSLHTTLSDPTGTQSHKHGRY